MAYQGPKHWLLIFLEISLSLLLSSTPDSKWESATMTRIYVEVPGVGEVPERKEGIIHQEKLSSLHLCVNGEGAQGSLGF